MAEHVGEAKCPECGEGAAVKADKRKFLYLDCTCGIFKYQSKSGQEKIKARWLLEQPEKAAAFLGVEAEPEAPKIEEIEPLPVVEKLEVVTPVVSPKKERSASPKKPGYFERSRQRRELRKVAKGAV